MLTLSKFINDKSPKFNKELVEGICHHRLNRAVDYIDSFIKYSSQAKTDTRLQYLGYEELSPKEEVAFIFNKKSRIVHDIAENDMYLVRFKFKYGDEKEVREHLMYLPYISKGNILRLSGNKFLVMPTLADKVISVGERVIFINILTAKYNFTRLQHPVMVNGTVTLNPVIVAVLYKNQVKRFDDTTKANPTIIHYLLANYGYSKTMEILIGFVPKPVYDATGQKGVVMSSTNNVPKGFVGDKSSYKPTNIKFVIPEKNFDSNVQYCIGNVYYVLDNFPSRVSIDTMDNPDIWKRFMGEIIHSGNNGLSYLKEKMYAHFEDLNSQFDTITIRKLKDINIDSTTLMGLLGVIFQNFNDWILHVDSRSLYNNKSYEVESFVLNYVTSRITRLVLDINKEELRLPNGTLDSVTLDKIFRKYMSTRSIFSLRKERMFLTSIDYSGDHLYYKNTSMVVQQESDFVNVNNNESNTSERGKLVASMATAGSILGLSKRNPTPMIRLNPYVETCPVTGTLLANPDYNDIIKETDINLANMEINEGIEDIDEIISELEDMDDLDYIGSQSDDLDVDNWNEE